MVMVIKVAVEKLLMSPQLDLVDQTVFRQNLQITVDSAQADSRDSFAYPAVNFIGGQMSIGFAELIENNLPLTGYT